MPDEPSRQKTEQPTAKRLREARRRGDVPHSREVGPTVSLLGLLGLSGLTVGVSADRLTHLFDMAFASIDQPFPAAAVQLAHEAGWSLVSIVAMVVAPIALLALVADFLQVGPVFAPDKVKPDFDKINPFSGFKRLITVDSLVELIKTVIKTLVLVLIAWLIARQMLPYLVDLPWGSAEALGQSVKVSLFRLAGWTIGVFAVLAIIDVLFQRYRYIQRLRMTIEEVQRDLKEEEGDPLIRGERRRMHRDWAESNAVRAAGQASVLVVNPTHIAVALDYDEADIPVPIVAAIGEDELALDMREAARRAGIPQLENVSLARALLADGEVGDIVPADLFNAVAQAIVWARAERQRLGGGRRRT